MTDSMTKNEHLKRFYSFVDKKSSNECWLWKGSLKILFGDNGHFQMNGKHYYTRRASWILHYGEIPVNMNVLNICKNKLCVNPNHLTLVNKDEMKDVLCPLESRFWNNVDKRGENECWEYKGTPSQTYPVIRRHGKQIRASRFSYELHYGSIPKGLLVCHRCDNPRCVNPAHLFLGTAKDNANDMINKGRWNGAKGEQVKGSRFKEADIQFIRQCDLDKSMSVEQLAKKYGVYKYYIRKIQRKEYWKWVN